MAVRLLELRRALKPNGALVLHGDATADAYLRILLDAIFGASNFQMTEPTQCHGSHLPRRNVGLNAGPLRVDAGNLLLFSSLERST